MDGHLRHLSNYVGHLSTNGAPRGPPAKWAVEVYVCPPLLHRLLARSPGGEKLTEGEQATGVRVDVHLARPVRCPVGSAPIPDAQERTPIDQRVARSLRRGRAAAMADRLVRGVRKHPR